MSDTIYTLTTKPMAKKVVKKEVTAEKGKMPFVPFRMKKGAKKMAAKTAKSRMKK